MTGYSRKGLDEYLNHPNVVGILEKPFSRKQLLLQIKRACESGRNSTTRVVVESTERRRRLGHG